MSLQPSDEERRLLQFIGHFPQAAEDIGALWAANEIRALRRIIDGLAERVAKQSNQLAQNAERDGTCLAANLYRTEMEVLDPKEKTQR